MVATNRSRIASKERSDASGGGGDEPSALSPPSSAPIPILRTGGGAPPLRREGVQALKQGTPPKDEVSGTGTFLETAKDALLTLAGRRTSSSKEGHDLKSRLSQSRSPHKYGEEYDEGEKLGEGITGTVRIVTHKRTGKRFAMKTINLDRINKSQLRELRLEVSALKLVDHPNIVRLYETFEDRTTMRLIMELCTGGELAKRRLRKESEVIQVVGQLLSAVAHIHNVGIVHRDIKLENVLFATQDPKSKVELIDFGLSGVHLKEGRRGLKHKRLMSTTCGTSYYIAPEVLEGKYSSKCDMWSLGVVVYMLLTGRPPFDGPNEKSVFRRIRLGIVDFGSPVWDKVSSHARSMVESLLVIDPAARWSAERALQSEWLNPYHDSVRSEFEDIIEQSVVTSLTNFVKYGSLKKAALMIIAHNKSHEELKELSSAFKAMDTDNSGTITISELKELLTKHGVVSDETIREIFDSVDVDSSGSIQFHEFLAATVEARCDVDREAFSAAFDRIADGKDCITKADLSKLLVLSSAQAKAIISEFDANNDGVISRDEFMTVVDAKETEVVENLFDSGILNPVGVSGDLGSPVGSARAQRKQP